MIIKKKNLEHWINNFYGYGSWSAKVWFVSYEEGGGDLPEEVAEKINYFHDTHSADSPALCDIRELYRHVTFRGDGPKSEIFSSLYDYRFDRKAMLQGAWKNLIAFAHGFRSKKKPDLLAYQKKEFLNANNEALIQLYPLPSPHNHAWYYSWLDLPQLGFIRNRSEYQEHVYPDRIRTILKNIVTNKPDVVVMYGMDNINNLKKSAQEFFPEAKFKMVKAIKLEIPQHHLAKLGETSLVITTQMPTLRHNRIETGFDWFEFGKMVKSGR